MLEIIAAIALGVMIYISVLLERVVRSLVLLRESLWADQAVAALNSIKEDINSIEIVGPYTAPTRTAEILRQLKVYFPDYADTITEEYARTCNDSYYNFRAYWKKHRDLFNRIAFSREVDFNYKSNSTQDLYIDLMRTLVKGLVAKAPAGLMEHLESRPIEDVLRMFEQIYDRSARF
jgi:hypothetical protein